MSFNKMPKMFDDKIHCEQFPIKGAITPFSMGKLTGKIGNWLPLIIKKLLEHSTNSYIRGISHCCCGGIRCRVKQ